MYNHTTNIFYDFITTDAKKEHRSPEKSKQVCSVVKF